MLSTASRAAPVLERRLQALLPDGVFVRAGCVEELSRTALIRGRVCLDPSPRAREFVAGRHLAAAALEAVGARSLSVAVGQRGMPSWPSGYTGSITHADGYCLVAVASAEVVRSLGIDLERSDHVTPDLANLIQADGEGHEPGGFSLAAYFSAKEALFKCQYPLTREEAEFTEARIAFDADGHFSVGVQAPRLELASNCVGRVASVGPFVIAAAWLPCASTLSLDGGAIRI